MTFISSFVFWSKWRKNEKISCHFLAKCGSFIQKVNKEDSWFFFILVILTKKRKMKRTIHCSVTSNKWEPFQKTWTLLDTRISKFMNIITYSYTKYVRTHLFYLERILFFPQNKIGKRPWQYWFPMRSPNFLMSVKVIYTKYSKHWLYTVAHTIECVCSKKNNSWFNPWFSFYFH